MSMDTDASRDVQFMGHALALAERAQQQGEVPVGAVVVHRGAIVGEGWNRTVGLNDPAAHAEILALREAGSSLGNYRLVDCTLYVTLEPCPMCVGACIHARIGTLVFGAGDPKTGAVGGCFNLLRAAHHNHAFEVRSGVLAEASGLLLKSFFRARR